MALKQGMVLVFMTSTTGKMSLSGNGDRCHNIERLFRRTPDLAFFNTSDTRTRAVSTGAHQAESFDRYLFRPQSASIAQVAEARPDEIGKPVGTYRFLDRGWKTRCVARTDMSKRESGS